MSTCCITNCRNKPGRDKDFKYYRFPWKPYETERRERWIEAVRSRMPENFSWKPLRERTVICSAHFVDGKKSEDMHSPSYIPTIFPAVNQQKSPSKVVQSTNKRPKVTEIIKNKKDCRQMTGTKSSTTATSASVNPKPGPSKFNHRSSQPKQATICTQTDITIDPYLEDLTKTALSIDSEEEQNENECMEKERKDFYGYVSIETEEQLTDMTGVTIDIFSYLLEMLPAAKENDEFSNKDKLLIFLMKMKIGLTDSAISVFFSCAPATVSCIFKNILDVLYERRKSFIFWPDKPTVLATLPNLFKDSPYRNCRLILNSTEFSTEEQYDTSNNQSNLLDKQTIRVVTGTTPSRFICFAASCCEGRTSDTTIALNSSLPSKLEPGDMVMVVKGFSELNDVLCEQNVVVLPLCHEDTDFSDLLDNTYSIANVRLLVEETNRRLSNYNILNSMPVDLLPDIDKVVQVVAILCNLEKPLK